MKKFIFITILFTFSQSFNAQDFNIGLSGLLPLGDASEFSDFGLSIEGSYLKSVSEKIDIGLTVGYINYFGKEVNVPFLGTINTNDVGFLPIAASGRFEVIEKFTAGVDLGYAIGIKPEAIDGGFYFAPKLQYGISQNLDIVLAYKNISVDRGAFEAISLGVELGL